MNIKTGFLLEDQDSQILFAVGQENITWQQAHAKIGMVSRYLREKNIKTVALSFDNAAYFAMALLACVAAKVSVYLPASLAAENRAWLMNHVDAYLADATIDHLPLPSLLTADWVDLPTNNVKLSFEHDTAIFLQTSGSSGVAKVLRKSWHVLWQEAIATAQALPSQVAIDKPVVLSSVSSQHMYGLSFRIVLSVYLRLPIYQDRLLFPETLLSTSHDFQSVLWVSSPTLLQALQESHDLALAKDKVLAIVSSGGALASHSKSFLTEKICPNVLEIYGSTETGVVAYRLDKVNWQFFNSVKHQETEQGLLIESAWCMEPQLLADAIVWHGSGFELLGRLDRIIKLADKRISLLQLEHQLLQHPYLADVHVVKHPEGSHLAAWVALNEFGIQAWKDNGRKLVIQALKQHIQGQQDKIAIPRHWRFAMTLPRNAQSKLKQIDVENAILQPITEPTVLQQHAVAEHEYHVRLQVPLDLQYFNGHFDSFHLVPGVVQIKWILKLLQQINWLQGSPRQFENLKFQHFLRPCDVMDVQFKRDMVRQKMTYQCTIGETKIASGRLCIPNGKGGEA